MPENPIVVNTFPTTKQQLISYGLGLAFTAASIGLVFGVSAIVSKVSDARAAKKHKDTPEAE